MGELISIVIPAYNIEGYLEATVDSVLAQTYRNIEVIIVDDGSKDSTLEVAKHISEKDDRVRVIHKENGGVTSARLAGVAAANGDWIGFVDGDDFTEPDMYERLLANAKKYGASISHCGYQMVFPSRVDYYHNTGKIFVQDNIKGLQDLLEGSIVEPGLWNKLYRRDMLDRLMNEDLMDRSVKNTEDLLMNFYIFRESDNSVFEDFCPYHYMLREGSATSATVNEHKLEDPVRVAEKIERDCSAYPELKIASGSKTLTLLVALATRSAGQNKELIKPRRKTARKKLRRRLGDTLKNAYPSALKLKVLWASVWPGSYCFVHSVYSKISGSDRKYEIK